MGSSLKEQLLKAGLIDETRAKQADRERAQKSQQARKARKSGKRPPPDAKDEAAVRARQERELHAQRSRELNQAREAERIQKAVKAQVKKMVQAATVAHGKGDIRYNFVDGTRIKRLYVDKAQQEALGTGDLAVAKVDGRYSLVPSDVALKIREKMPEAIVFLAEPQEVDPDDPYAAYPIPDDLEW